MASTPIKVNRGSDKTMRFEWKDDLDVAIPITNPRVIDASSKLTLTVVEVDLTLGTFDVKLEGTVGLPKGNHTFRVQVDVTGGDSKASPEVIINVV
jgi:hypothetical protein